MVDAKEVDKVLAEAGFTEESIEAGLQRLMAKLGEPFYVPEYPRMPLYRARVPSRSGKLGEVTNLLTASIDAAMQFRLREQCETWIAANPHPIFVCREHMYVPPHLLSQRTGGA